MALKDVKQYYLNMLSQYIEMKDDLVDFEQGLKDGYITEEQLGDAVADVNKVKENVDRLSYIMFLFDLPARKSKKDRMLAVNKNILELFSQKRATQEAVFDENTDVITHLRAELKRLKEETTNERAN